MTAIPTTVRIDEKAVVASGFALLDVDSTLSVEVGPLRLEFMFVDTDDTDVAIDPEQISPTGLRLRLKNFKSPFGAGFGPARVGTLMGSSLSVAVYVSALGDRQRATNFCLMMKDSPPNPSPPLPLHAPPVAR